MLIAAPPIIVGTVITVFWAILGRQLFGVGSSSSPDAQIFSSIFAGLGNIFIWFFECIATLIVMGGASRNFVRHLLFGEPITVKETYRNVRARLGGLITASTVITILLIFIGGLISYFGFFVLIIAITIIVAALSSVPLLATVVSLFLGLAILFGTGWVFFLAASRFLYVPQVMLVEGQGVFAAIGRSANLASGNVNRLYALFIFTTLATYLALFLFYIPLGWYAFLNGIEIFTFDADSIPAWYEVANQVISQASLILLMPVWMIGLCLLYVDERVRHEGYDIELMAARRLGEIPPVPRQFVNPLQPALAMNQAPNQPTAPQRKSSITTLGLN